MSKVVVVTGAGAGVGRATAEEFAQRGCDVALLSRDEDRLHRAADSIRSLGVRAVAVPVDMADAAAVDAAATQVQQELGPIDIWVNNAMVTIFGPVSSISPDEFRRGTEVTYLGQVYGTMAALSRMRDRGGTIVNVGSALSYRAVPLQSVYCGAKYAVRGFTDALRSELMHDNVPVHLTMVHLPALNTPQFDWAMNKMDKRPQPIPPIFQPEVAARGIVFAAFNKRREVWVGLPTVKVILANRIAPGLLDRYLAKSGYTGQLTNEAKPENAADNLFEPVRGDFGAHGRFNSRARDTSWELFTTRHRDAFAAGVLALLGVGAAALLGRRHTDPRRSRAWLRS
jgi:short-subunit dehydrogenase